ITNYNNKNENHFNAIKYLALNDFIIYFFLEIEYKECKNHEASNKLETFLEKIFLLEETEIQKNISNIFPKNKKISEDIVFYVFNKFMVIKTTENEALFNSICGTYDSFMNKYHESINSKNSLLSFYVFSCYYLQSDENDPLFHDTTMQIDYHPIDQLNVQNHTKIFTDKICRENTSIFRLGFLILPFFENDYEGENVAEKIFYVHKKIETFIKKALEITTTI
ncbi:hypothetical protein COBT_002526, partial [Conglomerata obtusa]